MALIANAFAGKLKSFILTLNEIEQTDKDVAITRFCTELESDVYTAIKSLTIVIPTGLIVVQGANGGGPVVATNIQPITITTPMIR